MKDYVRVLRFVFGHLVKLEVLSSGTWQVPGPSVPLCEAGPPVSWHSLPHLCPGAGQLGPPAQSPTVQHVRWRPAGPRASSHRLTDEPLYWGTALKRIIANFQLKTCYLPVQTEQRFKSFLNFAFTFGKFLLFFKERAHSIWQSKPCWSVFFWF